MKWISASSHRNNDEASWWSFCGWGRWTEQVYGNVYIGQHLKLLHYTKKIKVANTWLPSVGFRSWSRFLAVSLQVTWVTNPAVGCHYFLRAGPAVTPTTLKRAATNFAAWWTEAQWVWTVCPRRYPTALRLRFEHRPYCASVQHAYTTLHQFNGLFTRTTWVSQYQKGKTCLDLNEAIDYWGFWDEVASAWPYANNLHLASGR